MVIFVFLKAETVQGKNNVSNYEGDPQTVMPSPCSMRDNLVRECCSVKTLGSVRPCTQSRTGRKTAGNVLLGKT